MSRGWTWWLIAGVASVLLWPAVPLGAAQAEDPPDFGPTAMLDSSAPEAKSLNARPAGGDGLDALLSGDRCLDACVCDPGWTFVSGAEATFLVPHVNGCPSYVATGTAGAAEPDTTTFMSDADADRMGFAPRVWLGTKRGPWGIVGRFWYFEESQRSFNPVNWPTDTYGFMAENTLKAYTVDVELTLDWCPGLSKTQFSLGPRYASLETSGLVSANNTIGATSVFGMALTSRQISGTGLTLAWTGTRPMTDRCGNLSLFWNLRSSILWGDSQACAESMTAAGAGAYAAGGTSAMAGTNGSLFIGEIQLGVQWERQLKCIPANAFLRLAGEYQYWDASANLGAASWVESAVVPGAVLSVADARGALRMDMIGFSIGCGLTW
jgi:hypothetical protein